MNNKGQVLAIFVILFPIIVSLFAIVIDLGFLYFEKRNIQDSVVEAAEFYLEHKEKVDVLANAKVLLSKNIKGNIEVNIKENDLYVEIEVKKNRKSFIKTKIQVIYKGYFDSNNIIKG